MKPPACVRCKWGTGTTCERPPNSVAAKEVQKSLEAMMAERVRQDSAWAAPPQQTTTYTSAERLHPSKESSS